MPFSSLQSSTMSSATTTPKQTASEADTFEGSISDLDLDLPWSPSMVLPLIESPEERYEALRKRTDELEQKVDQISA